MRGVRRITHDISDISPASFILQTELCNLLVSILGRFLEHKTLQLYGKKKMLNMLLSKRPSHIKRNASVMAHCLPSFELFTSQLIFKCKYSRYRRKRRQFYGMSSDSARQ